jgi:hypothetical protein
MTRTHFFTTMLLATIACGGDDGSGDATAADDDDGSTAPDDDDGSESSGATADDGSSDGSESPATDDDGTSAADSGDASTGAGVFDPAVCQPDAGGFTIEIDNAFYPLVVGQVSVFEGMEGDTLLHIEIEVLDETRDVAGVTTRVIEEREQEDGEIVEVSRNFFVQAADGTVCYYGEEVDIYENGEIVEHEGAWEAGVDGALPGVVMPAVPMAGQSFDQEVAPGIAEDHAEIVSLGDPVEVPAGMFDDTLRTEETTPLEPGVMEYKDYARGVGLLTDGPARLLSY